MEAVRTYKAMVTYHIITCYYKLKEQNQKDQNFFSNCMLLFLILIKKNLVKTDQE